jgi:hypothetical protein
MISTTGVFCCSFWMLIHAHCTALHSNKLDTFSCSGADPWTLLLTCVSRSLSTQPPWEYHCWLFYHLVIGHSIKLICVTTHSIFYSHLPSTFHRQISMRCSHLTFYTSWSRVHSRTILRVLNKVKTRSSNPGCSEKFSVTIFPCLFSPRSVIFSKSYKIYWLY